MPKVTLDQLKEARRKMVLGKIAGVETPSQQKEAQTRSVQSVNGTTNGNCAEADATVNPAAEAVTP